MNSNFSLTSLAWSVHPNTKPWSFCTNLVFTKTTNSVRHFIIQARLINSYQHDIIGISLFLVTFLAESLNSKYAISRFNPIFFPILNMYTVYLLIEAIADK